MKWFSFIFLFFLPLFPAHSDTGTPSVVSALPTSIAQPDFSNKWFLKVGGGTAFDLQNAIPGSSSLNLSLSVERDTPDGFACFVDVDRDDVNVSQDLLRENYCYTVNLERRRFWAESFVNPYFYGGLGLLQTEYLTWNTSLALQWGLGSEWAVGERTVVFLETAAHYGFSPGYAGYQSLQAGFKVAIDAKEPEPTATPQPVTAVSTPGPTGPPLRLFDYVVSFPMNFIGTPDIQKLYPPSPSWVTPGTQFGFQMNVDFYLWDDLTLGPYCQVLVKNSTGPYDTYGVGTLGAGARLKKEIPLLPRWSLEPYLAGGFYWLSNVYYTGSAPGGEGGLDLVYYLNDARDASLEVGAGYRGLTFKPIYPNEYYLNGNEPVRNYDGSQASFDFSGWTVNFLQLKETFEENAPAPAQAPAPPKQGIQPFLRIGAGVVPTEKYSVYTNNDTAMLEGGFEFPDGLGFLLGCEWLPNPVSDHWAWTANIRYKAQMFQLIKPYVFAGIGEGHFNGTYWTDNPASVWTMDFQAGLGAEYELTPELALFVDYRLIAEVSETEYYFSNTGYLPLQTGLRVNL